MMPGKDPYLYPDSKVLINNFGIRDKEILNREEAAFTAFRMRELIDTPIQGNFDLAHLCAIHEYIFHDVFSWAGQIRTIDMEKPERVLAWRSVKYANVPGIEREVSRALNQFKAVDWQSLTIQQKAREFSRLFALLWQIHPFREGNTRTVTQFCCQLAEKSGMPLDYGLLAQNSEYLRTALVAACARFAEEDDLGDRAKPEYLEKIILDAMQRQAG